MYANTLFHSQIPSKPFTFLHFSSHPLPKLLLPPLNCTPGDDSRPATPSLEAVEIRFRRSSRKRRQQQEEEEEVTTKKEKKSAPPKKWEEMSFSEKALELYVGEKGALFWLNKFAYASIYIIIGAWILFRFVGPALNLYHLDSDPLAPESLFKGS